MQKVVLDGQTASPRDLYNASQSALDPKAALAVKLAPAAQKKVQAAASFVDQIAKKKKPVYSINTGFGKFAEVAISPKDLAKLQLNLIHSHCVGVGEPLPRDLVLLMLLIRLNTLCRGQSGIRLQSLDLMMRLIEAGVLPIVPSRGSVGASGDLAPSAHASLMLIGEGRVSRPNSNRSGFEIVSARDALKKLGLKPLVLAPKEGLALINGTQLSTALALKVWAQGSTLIDWSSAALALSIEGLRASHDLFDERILVSRNQSGPKKIGLTLSKFLSGPSQVKDSHVDCGRVQDPYSLRCAPQVLGAVLDDFDQSHEILKNEINASTDNPLLFASDGASLSGGNFHAVYPARVSDRLNSALATLAAISERRVALMMSPESSRLFPFLIEGGGLNSGFMMVQVTAAALASEAKTGAFPASVDSIPTSDDREDHVSMGPTAGYRALRSLECARGVVAIELLAGAQCLDLLRPLKSTKKIEALHRFVRQHSRYLDQDRELSSEMMAMDLAIQTEVNL
jgi:histidine ammonia-lyase